MVEQTDITAADFFWNAAAQDAGFSGALWVEAYQRYLDAVEQDPSRSLEERWHTPRTVRVPFRQGHVEVLVRTQPDGREYCALRFTAFPGWRWARTPSAGPLVLAPRRRTRNPSCAGRGCPTGCGEPVVMEYAPACDCRDAKRRIPAVGWKTGSTAVCAVPVSFGIQRRRALSNGIAVSGRHP